MSHLAAEVITVLQLLFSVHQTASAQVVPFTSSNLPIVIIETDGACIPDEPKVPASMRIIRNREGRNYIADTRPDYDGMIGIEIRGSTSQSYPKKQFGLETRDSAGYDDDVSLMGFPKESDWILYAPYADKSLIRDALTHELARRMGWYASRSQFCEVVIDGSYRGLYLFMEKLKRDKNRINISKLEPEDTQGDAVTGGDILRLDHNAKPEDKGFAGAYDSAGYFTYWYEYPDTKDITPEQEAYIQEYLSGFEKRMHETDYGDPVTGYEAYINTDSFIDYFLLTELTNSIDGYIGSAFFFKDRQSAGGKLTMGPMWDYNSAFGNAFYNDGWRSDGWRLYFNRVPFWWRRLASDPAFVTRTRDRWIALRKTILANNAIENLIDSLTAGIDEAQRRNFAKWNILGEYVWPNIFVGKTYDEEVTFLKEWIWDRLGWIDANIYRLTRQGVTGRSEPWSYFLSLHPQPASGNITVRYSLGRYAIARVIVCDMSGSQRLESPSSLEGPGIQTHQLQTAGLAAGVYSVVLFVNDKAADFETAVIMR
jgi:hypothetical protein